MKKCPTQRQERGDKAGRALLKIEIGDPVDQVEETERRGEEDARVRVNLGDADVQAAVPPRPRATVLEAAEEAGAVLPVQTLVAVLLVALVHVRGVVHLDGRGRARADVHRGRLLSNRKPTVRGWTRGAVSGTLRE